MKKKDRRSFVLRDVIYKRGPAGEIHLRIGTEDIIAAGCVLVATVAIIGLVFGAIDARIGGGIIAGALGAGGVARVIKARNRRRR